MTDTSNIAQIMAGKGIDTAQEIKAFAEHTKGCTDAAGELQDAIAGIGEVLKNEKRCE